MYIALGSYSNTTESASNVLGRQPAYKDEAVVASSYSSYDQDTLLRYKSIERFYLYQQLAQYNEADCLGSG
jgi:hypothetical protein